MFLTLLSFQIIGLVLSHILRFFMFQHFGFKLPIWAKIWPFGANGRWKLKIKHSDLPKGTPLRDFTFWACVKFRHRVWSLWVHEKKKNKEMYFIIFTQTQNIIFHPFTYKSPFNEFTTKFGVWDRPADLINLYSFCGNQFKGFDSVGVKMWPFQLTWRVAVNSAAPSRCLWCSVKVRYTCQV